MQSIVENARALASGLSPSLTPDELQVWAQSAAQLLVPLSDRVEVLSEFVLLSANSDTSVEDEEQDSANY